MIKSQCWLLQFRITIWESPSGIFAQKFLSHTRFAVSAKVERRITNIIPDWVMVINPSRLYSHFFSIPIMDDQAAHHYPCGNSPNWEDPPWRSLVASVVSGWIAFVGNIYTGHHRTPEIFRWTMIHMGGASGSSGFPIKIVTKQPIHLYHTML